jgi:hypothetical protein
MKLSLLFVAVCALGSANAMASSVECSNANGTVRYSAFFPDGGPHRESDVTWTIDGERLIEESSMEIVAPGGNGFQRPRKEVVSEFKNIEELKKYTKDNFEHTTYSSAASIFRFPASAVEQSDSIEVIRRDEIMICESQRYVGIPRP